jgi:hypothetical protein
MKRLFKAVVDVAEVKIEHPQGSNPDSADNTINSGHRAWESWYCSHQAWVSSEQGKDS